MATLPVQITLPRDEDEKRSQLDVSELEALRVPPPRYRHAAPSAPWPWMNFNEDRAEVVPLSPTARDTWEQYPQSHFGNWTPDQVERCKMLSITTDKYSCAIHTVDVFSDGKFDKTEKQRTRHIPSDEASTKQFWEDLQQPPPGHLRVQALFIENITLNVLKMLGAKYDIEPFFFASSANWIPSRYQENPHYGKDDHITVVLPFIRVVNNEFLKQRASPLPPNEIQYPPTQKTALPITDKRQTIDTQAPLVLSEQKVVLQDLLAIHMVRNTETNVIISYHHQSALQKTTARKLQSLVQRTGDSVYWQKIYEKSRDPTFVFLAILWYALYAWDEALEVLYAHLSEELEAAKADSTTHLHHTRELHKLQAHLLYYQQLLRDFHKSVEFVKKTDNPAMYHESISPLERHQSKELMGLEADHLLSEIDRLEKQRQTQSDRLKNAMGLAFSTVNIEDSKSMQSLTRATLKDSAAMKQISYLTMIFLPASYLSSVFGMNVQEINPGTNETLGRYILSTILLTLFTAWLVVALQNHSTFHPGGKDIIHRVGWPIFYIIDLAKRIKMSIRKPYVRVVPKPKPVPANL